MLPSAKRQHFDAHKDQIESAAFHTPSHNLCTSFLVRTSLGEHSSLMDLGLLEFQFFWKISKKICALLRFKPTTWGANPNTLINYASRLSWNKMSYIIFIHYNIWHLFWSQSQTIRTHTCACNTTFFCYFLQVIVGSIQIATWKY